MAEPPARELKLPELLPCFDPRRDQTDIVHAGLVAEVNDLGDFAEIQVLVPFDEHDLLAQGPPC